jgi:hypothetical protein
MCHQKNRGIKDSKAPPAPDTSENWGVCAAEGCIHRVFNPDGKRMCLECRDKEVGSG